MKRRIGMGVSSYMETDTHRSMPVAGTVATVATMIRHSVGDDFFNSRRK